MTVMEAPKPGIGDAGDPTRALHALLRQGTRLAHDRVERAFDLTAATGKVETYVAALSKMQAAYAGLLPALDRIGIDGGDNALQEVRTRMDRLRDDLRAFGLEPEPPRLPPLRLEDRGEVLGCEYVIRGSSLGGLVIFRLAVAKLGVTETNGGSFFHGDSNATKTRWSAFLLRLAALDGSSAEADRVVRGANKTFDFFEKALTSMVPSNGAAVEG